MRIALMLSALCLSVAGLAACGPNIDPNDPPVPCAATDDCAAPADGRHYSCQEYGGGFGLCEFEDPCPCDVGTLIGNTACIVDPNDAKGNCAQSAHVTQHCVAFEDGNTLCVVAPMDGYKCDPAFPGHQVQASDPCCNGSGGSGGTL